MVPTHRESSKSGGIAAFAWCAWKDASEVAGDLQCSGRRQKEEVFMSVCKLEFLLSTHCVRVMLPALLLAGMAAAEASNLDFLNDTPMSCIKKRDMDSIKSALVEVLNTKNDGETTRWINEGTGNSVKIDAAMTPESTSREGERTCRLVSVVLSAKGQSMNLHPRFCGTSRTDWTLQQR
jgi:hypothetical protein